MSTIRNETLPGAEGVQLLPSRAARRVLAVCAFAALTALSARISIPLPGTPVPFSFQPLVVMLAGALLGARLGAYSQALYLAAGMVGLPVFAAGGGLAYLLGPTGGYLVAYPLAAFVTGAIVGQSVFRTVLGLLAGLAVVYLGGVSWLALGGSFSGAVALGLLPFLAADLVKVGLAAIATHLLRPRTNALLEG
jgi:biotin transport system substrate-specific component